MCWMVSKLNSLLPTVQITAQIMVYAHRFTNVTVREHGGVMIVD